MVKNKLKKLGYEQNYVVKNSVGLSVHAEIDALKDLQKHKTFYKQDKKYVDLLVIRLSKSNVCGNSRPCLNCLVKLIKSGVNIRYVYYSTNDSVIIREKFTDMLESKSTYVSSGNRHRSAP